MAEETITNAFIKFRLPGTLPSVLLPGGSVTRTLNSFTSGPPNYVNFIGGPIGYNSSLTYTIYAVETGVTLHVVDDAQNDVEYRSGVWRLCVSESSIAIGSSQLIISYAPSFNSVSATVEYPFAIDPDSYVKRDLVDFAPRAGGGDVAYSNLDLYQIITQDSWHHGFGFTQFRDKFGHRITNDGVDTRHIGMALMSPKYSVAYSAATGGMRNCVDFLGDTYFNLGTGGVWKRTTSNGLFSKVLTANVVDLISNGSYLVASISAARMKTSINGTSWADAGVSGNTPTNFGKLAIHNGFMWGSEASVATRSLAGTYNASFGMTVVSGGGYSFYGVSTLFVSQLNVGDIVKIGATVVVRVWNIFSNTIFSGGVQVGGTLSGGEAFVAQTPGLYYDSVHFWSSADSADAEGGGIADVASIGIGIGSPGIVGLVSFNGALHVARPDGVWAIDDTVVPPVARRVLSFSDEQHSSNFSIFTTWRGRLYFNIKNMLYAYNGASLANVTPPTYSLDYPPLQFGSISGSAYRGAYLYTIAINNEASPTYCLLCFDGTGWFELANLGATAPSGIGYSPLVNKIFVGITGGVIWSIPMQATSELPYAEFSTTGHHYLNLSEFDFGFRRVKKSFAEIDVEVYNVAAGRYVGVDYSADGGAWYRLGYTTQSGVTQLNMNPTVEANKLDVRMDFQTNDAAQSVIMRNFTLKAMVRPDVLYGHQMMVLGGDQIQMLDGMQHTLSSEEQKNILETIRNSKAPVTYIDPFGISHDAYISSCTFRNLKRRPGEKRSNWGALINVVEVR